MNTPKKIEKNKTNDPLFLYISVFLALFSLVFLVAYNQSQYANKGTNDSLTYTLIISFVPFISFLDFLLYFAIPNNYSKKGRFLFALSVVQLIFIILSALAYLSHYTETINSIRISRYLALTSLLILWALGVYSKYLTYFSKDKNQEILAKLHLILFYSSLSISNLSILLSCLSILLTMQLTISHYVFIFVIMEFVLVALLLLFSFLPLRIKQLSMDLYLRYTKLGSALIGLFFLITIIATIAAYTLKDQVSYQLFYWLISMQIFGMLLSSTPLIVSLIKKSQLLEEDDIS